MILKDIMAMSGEPGLFKFIAQGKNAIIVEHLETKKRSSAYSTSKVSSLEDIAIFTEKEDMPLGKVFDLIHAKENGGPAIDSKVDAEALKTWFEGLLPEYSKDKVYTSDIKKGAHWYNILHSLNLLVKEEPEKAAEEKESEAATERLRELGEKRAISMAIAELEGVGETVAERLISSVIHSIEQLAESTLEQLTSIEGIGPKKAHKILESAKNSVNKSSKVSQKETAEQSVS